MGDDLTLDMSGMKISFHGQELKTVKEINIPSDVEVPDELPLGHINAFPDEAHGSITLKLKRRPRRRQIERAYKIMGTTIMRELYKVIMKKWLLNGGRAIMKARANAGKSDAFLGIVGRSDEACFVGSPCDNKDCLAYDGLTGQCEINCNCHLAAEREV